MPEATQNLFAIALLKLQLKQIGVIKLEVSDQYGYIYFNEKPHVDPRKIIQLIQKQPKNYQLVSNSTLKFKVAQTEPSQRIALTLQILNSISTPL